MFSLTFVYKMIFTLIPKMASLSRQELQPTGTAKWPTTLRFGKILETTSVVKSRAVKEYSSTHSRLD